MAKGKTGHALEALKVFEGLNSAGFIKALSQEAANEERRQIFSSYDLRWYGDKRDFRYVRSSLPGKSNHKF